MGLKGDGTVVTTGVHSVGGWTDIIQVSAGGGNYDFYQLGHTVGLKGNGTVVAGGDNTYGQCDVGGWDLN